LLNLDYTCRNTLIGYQGCFDSITLKVGIDVVDSIEECIKSCTVKYNYAGIMNGYRQFFYFSWLIFFYSVSNLCYCGNDLYLPSVNSNLCNIQCSKSSNELNIDCCGGLDVFSVYNIKNYR